MVDVTPLVDPVGLPVGNFSVEGVLSGVEDGLAVDDPVRLLLIRLGRRERDFSVRA